MTKLAPKLRFPEFTDEWQVKKLEDVFEYEQPTRYLVKSTEYSDAYDTPVLTAGKTFVLGKTNETNGIFQERLPVTLFDDFTTASQWVDFPFKLKSSAAKILIAKRKYSPKIAHVLLQKVEFKAEDHKRYWISTYQNFDINVPLKPEQEKIADFLTALDERIGLSEQRFKQLQRYKRSVMQKIFIQQIRFKDENGNDYPDWEEKRTGELFTPISNRKHNGELPVLSITQDEGVVRRDSLDRKIDQSDVGVLNYKIIEPNDFVISLRSFQGGIEMSNILGISSPAYTVLHAHSDVVPDMFKHYFKRDEFISKLNSTVIGIRDGKQISYEPFSTIKLLLPAKKEQQKIANFLTAIDDRITVEQTKLTAARQFKRALLQRMFI